jgi:hypothetical protein
MMECWNVGILLKKVIPLILFILSIEISVITVHSVRDRSLSLSLSAVLGNQKSQIRNQKCLMLPAPCSMLFASLTTGKEALSHAPP